MASRFFAAGVLTVVLVALVASPAAAKEGVVARVVTPISRDAEPGSTITVVWTLTFVEAGKRKPFGGGAVFLRLFGTNGSRSARVYAEPMAPGRYRASARVPRGGVKRVVFGLMGMVCQGRELSDCRPSPAIFPIVGRVFR
jgi:hypothetical protein